MRPSPSDVRRAALAAATVFALSPCAALVAQGTVERRDQASTAETATFLLVPLGARSVGLGGANAAARADVEGVLWNPASTGRLAASTLFAHVSNDFGSASVVLGGVAVIRRLRLGAAFYHFDLGTVDARDASNQSIGTLEPNDAAFIVTAAAPVAADIEVGAAGKLLRLSSSCGADCTSLGETATGLALDLGAVAGVPGVRGLDLGLSLRNLGPGLGYGGGRPKDALPTRIRAGAEIDVPALLSDGRWADGELGLRARLDLQETFSEFDDLNVFAGVELDWADLLRLRAGHAWAGSGRTGLSVGLGLHWNRLDLDLARSFDDFSRFDSDAPFQASLGFRL